MNRGLKADNVSAFADPPIHGASRTAEALCSGSRG